MRISAYTRLLVSLCMVSALLILYILSNKYLELEQAIQTQQQLQQSKNDNEITRIMLNQWATTIDLYYLNKQPFLAQSVKAHTMQLGERLRILEQSMPNTAQISQLRAYIHSESQNVERAELTGQQTNPTAKNDRSSEQITQLFDSMTKMLAQEYDAAKLNTRQINNSFQQQAIFWLLSYIALVIMASYWTSRTLIKPIEQLTKLTENDPTGRQLAQLHLQNGPHEVRRLADSFSSLYQRINAEIEETLQSRAAEQRAMDRLKALVDNVSLSIITIDTKGTINSFNPATSELFNLSAELLYGAQITDLLPTLKIHGGLFQQILNAGVDIEVDAIVKDSVKTVELSCAELSFSDDKHAESQYILILHDISQRKKSEDRIKKMNQRLINTSRQAGIAEIATSILHSVGNVLNSVNTSVSMLQQGLERGKNEGLKKSSEMLRSQGAALFEANGKSEQLLDYLDALIAQQEIDRGKNLQEIASLKQNINHIAEIVSAQQKFSGKSGVIERLNISKLIEEALNINVVSMENNKVEIERHYNPVLEIMGDRSKIVQILVNLIRNANEAMMPPRPTPPKIIIRAEIVGHQIEINVQDNGHGISEENMKQMFRYGFTTKTNGHGFGLHSCAIAAKEMFGSLTVHSEGKDKGARFELILPLDPADRERLQIQYLMTPQKEIDNG